MRLLSILCGVVVMAIHTAPATCQEPTTENSAQQSGSTSPPRPEIPFGVLQTHVLQETGSIQLSPEQAARRDAIRLRFSRGNRRFATLQTVNRSQAGSNPRFEMYLKKAELTAQDQCAREILAFLTDEQESMLRIRNRSEIETAIRTRQFSQLHPGLENVPVFQLFDQKDLLAASLHPRVETQLRLTGHQYIQLDALTQEMDSNGPERVCQLLERFPDELPEKSFPVSTQIHKSLQEETNAILTPEQREKYANHQKALMEQSSPFQLASSGSVTGSPEEFRSRAMLIREQFAIRNRQTHGSRIVQESRTVDGRVEFTIELSNYFAQPGVASDYGLSSEQLQKIAEILEKTQGDLERIAMQHAQQRLDDELRVQTVIDGMITDFNRQATTRLHEILSSDQYEALMKCRYYGISPRQLTRKDVSEILNLTDTQKVQIRGILSERRPGSEYLSLPSLDLSFEERQKLFEEHRKSFFENSRKDQEFMNEQQEKALALLTAAQREQYCTISGHSR